MAASCISCCKEYCKRKGQRKKLRGVWLTDTLQRLTGSEESIPTPCHLGSIAQKKDLLSRLRKLVAGVGGKDYTCELFVFGSSENNFGSEGSDMDLCMRVVRQGKDPMDIDAQDVLKRLASLLDMSGFGEIDTSRATARVPIIMFVDTGVTGIHCDVCINNELALRNTQLLKAYSQIDERVRLIAYVVKTWSKRRRINEPSDGTLSSYAYLLLLLSRLQSVGMLPYLQSLPEDWSGQEGFGEHSGKGSRVKSPNGQEWDTYFYDPSANGLARALAKGCKISIGQILVEFFWHYASERSYRREVVSVRIKGGSISKDAKVDEYGWKEMLASPLKTLLSTRMMLPMSFAMIL